MKFLATAIYLGLPSLGALLLGSMIHPAIGVIFMFGALGLFADIGRPRPERGEG